MGFYFTVTEPQKVSQGKLIFTQKTASREIFCYPIKSSPKNRLEAPELRQKNRLISTRNASGIPYWPSRDPIGEKGGANLYGMVDNDSTAEDLEDIGKMVFLMGVAGAAEKYSQPKGSLGARVGSHAAALTGIVGGVITRMRLSASEEEIQRFEVF